MCGVVGFIEPGLKQEALNERLSPMVCSLAHRGPDDEGSWIDPAHGIALGQRRLSILDLSPLGHQPMSSASGRFVTVYNGEIFNFRALREQLSALGCSFRGGSDTEVMLAAFETWGVRASVERFVGMFAIALWDREQASLTLIRDRIGKKPLYYGHVGSCFAFASELKALRQRTDFANSINRDALALFFRHGYVPGPYSIYEGIHKLPPASILVRDRQGEIHCESYWSPLQCAQNPLELDDTEAMNRFEELLRDSVRLRLESDAPIGCFLSGGIDSSLVTATMQSLSSQPIRTFSVGFHEREFDEAGCARQVARHLGTHHTELYVTGAEAEAVVPRLPTLYDEPFADNSQIPTFLICQLARQQVTVCLSGDGGDELFYGYSRYLVTDLLWSLFRRIPLELRERQSRLLESIVSWLRVRATLPQRWLRRPQRFAELLKVPSHDELYRKELSLWDNPNELVLGSRQLPTLLTDSSLADLLPDSRTRKAFIDLKLYLPDDILVKVDRASMGVSLEARTPLLDHRLVEFCLSLPHRFRHRERRTKWLLRKVLYRHVPRELLERPKMGFGAPIGRWLNGSLRDWADDLLSPERLRRQGYLQPEMISQRWFGRDPHENKVDNRVWTALMFQAWLEAQQRETPHQGPSDR